MILLLSIIGSVVVIDFLFICIFKYFIQHKNRVNNTWGNWEVVLKGRPDLILNPINVVKNYTKQKKDSCSTIAKAQNVATISILLFCLVASSCIVIQDPAAKPGLPQYDSFDNWQEVPYTESSHHNDSEKERIYIVDFENIILDAPLAAEIIPTRERSRVEIIAPEKILKRLRIEKRSDSCPSGLVKDLPFSDPTKSGYASMFTGFSHSRANPLFYSLKKLCSLGFIFPPGNA